MRHHLLLRLIALFLFVPAAGNAMEVKKLLDLAKPSQPPDPRTMVIPPLSCISKQVLVINHSTLETSKTDSVLYLRMRGTLLYMGKVAGEETVTGTILRNDRRRWSIGNAQIILDENLKIGAWIKVDPDTTTLRSLQCSTSPG